MSISIRSAIRAAVAFTSLTLLCSAAELAKVAGGASMNRAAQYSWLGLTIASQVFILYWVGGFKVIYAELVAARATVSAAASGDLYPGGAYPWCRRCDAATPPADGSCGHAVCSACDRCPLCEAGTAL